MEIQLSPIPMGAVSSHFLAISMKFSWLIMASFGSPVVPDVMIIKAVSSGFPLVSSLVKKSGFSLSKSAPRSNSSLKLRSHGSSV